MNFESLIGKRISFSLSLDPNSALVVATVRGADLGGVWVEYQTITDQILKSLDISMLEKTPLMFIPYSRIMFAFASNDVPSISSRLTE